MSLKDGATLGTYRIVSTLGVGGMGEVYRARDPSLGREIAVKVLPEAMATDPERLERFEREARTVASLSHPNIVTIHSVEESDGLRFITMELVEGQTLDRLIPPGGLPLSRFFELARPIVDALATAHEGGITHRDLKPENVMVGSDGRVRVLDFGLAKARIVEESGDDEATRALTDAGRLLGTIPYMSPEQVKGQLSDHRSDVFSLGVLLFEMAAGDRPFRGETSADVMSAILRDRPPSITELKADLPRDLASILRRCLEKAPASRFHSARELATALEELKGALDSGEAKTSRASIAVLPFVNMSADPEQEFFCDGMAEDVIDALTHVEGLHVVARTSSFQFRGSGLDLREIGEKLGVTTVLEGSVRKAGNRVRISSRLVNISSGYDLWSERYDRELDDIFAVQDEISAAIVDTLKTKLVPTTAPASIDRAPRTRHQPSPEIYELLLKARFFRNTESKDGLDAAMRCLNEALESDPELVEAHTLIASSYVALHAYGFLSAAEAEPLVEQHSLRALELDDGFASSHSVYASLNAYMRWDWGPAEESAKRALEIEPGAASLHRSAAMTVYAPLGRMDEAVEAMRTAYRLDPLQQISSRNLAENLYWSGRLHDALRQFEHTLAMGPSPLARGQLAAVYSALGEPEKALAVRQEDLRQAGRDAAAEELGRAFADAGEEGVYRWYLDELERRALKRPVSAYSRALLHAVLGEADAAFRWLDEAIDQHLGLLMWVKVNPWLEGLHADPRWAAVLGRMGTG
jgi:serine/threonine-protein kinase